jgi:D-alanyl-D-alanine dipeptidase
VHDAYRPWYVTKIFWDATPTDKHEFVADPAVGSRHNRGCAVDLTLYDLKTGRTVEMPGLYDEMSARAYPTYAGGTAEQRRLRDLLRRHTEAEGFTVYEYEWWHFDYRDWKSYAIQNARFEALGATRWAMGRRAPLRMWLVVTGADEMVRRAGFLWALTGLMRRAPTA